ncbi:hypothetical protein [Niabella drilacis]|uniref:Uncharacterized protein n=1 Tax=Niabella drilacis (strain DSM 25811 / CCM 8410 / CCUG 62505 / LMG 26954 / E90) TaxID=1285928 RepID=A0A1G6QB80_NIADE|nr:hypothetical protein [Niabella drilacis]SDC89619.1 hypothetical protein SAMN04487894_104346 [Niabella drilacis]
MKTNFKQIFLAAAAALFLLVSCKKEHTGQDGSGNSYTYANGGNPKTEKIARATWIPEGKEMRLLLYNSGNANDGVELYLETAGPNFSAIPEGTFTNAPDNVAFRSAILYYNDGDESYTVSNIGRKITIAKDGNNYKINFEFTSSMGLVQGSYNGPVERAQ